MSMIMYTLALIVFVVLMNPKGIPKRRTVWNNFGVQ